jgi:hypothetical protein
MGGRQCLAVIGRPWPATHQTHQDSRFHCAPSTPIHTLPCSTFNGPAHPNGSQAQPGTPKTGAWFASPMTTLLPCAFPSWDPARENIPSFLGPVGAAPIGQVWARPSEANPGALDRLEPVLPSNL